MQGEAGLARDQFFGDQPAGNQNGLGRDHVGDAPGLEQSGKIDPAGTAGRRINVGHRPGRLQGLPECRNRGDIRQWIAVAHRHPDTDLGQIARAAGRDQVFLPQPFHPGRRQDRHIESLPGLDPAQ